MVFMHEKSCNKPTESNISLTNITELTNNNNLPRLVKLKISQLLFEIEFGDEYKDIEFYSLY